jgi:hypothetical protein
MLAPLVAEQLVPPVEPLVAIPITAWIEALKSMHDRKMFLEMTCEVGVSAEGLVALRMRTEEARWGDPISTLVKKKKNLTCQWQACQTPRLHEPGHCARSY